MHWVKEHLIFIAIFDPDLNSEHLNTHMMGIFNV